MSAYFEANGLRSKEYQVGPVNGVSITFHYTCEPDHFGKFYVWTETQRWKRWKRPELDHWMVDLEHCSDIRMDMSTARRAQRMAKGRYDEARAQVGGDRTYQVVINKPNGRNVETIPNIPRWCSDRLAPEDYILTMQKDCYRLYLRDRDTAQKLGFELALHGADRTFAGGERIFEHDGTLSDFHIMQRRLPGNLVHLPDL